MADRWSNPSGSLGVNRFRVWPDKNVDSWDTAEMVANFDKLDAIIGVPANGTQWPPDEGTNGGIYKQIALLQNDRCPVGAVLPFWRPNTSVTIPAGFVAMTGQTLTAAEHDFAGGGDITLPDTRNSIILGADFGKALLDAGVPGDLVGNAPGIGGQGGSNALKDLVHSHTVDDHMHGLNDHTHPMPHTHSLAGHTHNMDHRHKGSSQINETNTQNENEADQDHGAAGGSAFTASRSSHRHSIGAPRASDDSGPKTQTGGPSVGSSGASSAPNTEPSLTMDTMGAMPGTDDQLSVVDTRMKFVGFVLLLKVKHTTSL